MHPSCLDTHATPRHESGDRTPCNPPSTRKHPLTPAKARARPRCRARSTRTHTKQKKKKKKKKHRSAKTNKWRKVKPAGKVQKKWRKQRAARKVRTGLKRIKTSINDSLISLVRRPPLSRPPRHRLGLGKAFLTGVFAISCFFTFTSPKILPR